ncbi:hypothetical protein DEU56DRAFT_759720 [Suillus clintonianus]|uniref:uncharacterized protein n=1 Tax=Suillus clintonianus TaxID=1904413 RepID=UPI001B864A61|nr:uncharacterized protein DEU56DRAFT_759720 [Suillus clintonianus]KAG2124365.1 hypothetical protein DEU56DRAFT_759720 [Suillus clintonianus]
MTLIDADEVEQYGEELKLRIKKLSNYSNSKANVYALGHLLPNMMWGPYKAIGDRSKILCDPVIGEPLTVWILGHTMKKWFTKNGQPDNQASITMIPLSQILAQQSAVLLTKLGHPAGALSNQEICDICAVKWQSSRINKESTTPLLFDTVYNARKEGSLKNYCNRPLWDLANLKAGDLILLEARITCYSVKNTDKRTFITYRQHPRKSISIIPNIEIEPDHLYTLFVEGESACPPPYSLMEGIVEPGRKYTQHQGNLLVIKSN